MAGGRSSRLRAFLAQAGIEADQEALTGKVGAGNLGHGVGQQLVRLQRRRPLLADRLQQLAQIGALQSRDPVEIGRRHRLPDPRRGQHAAVAEEGNALDAEAAAKLPDLARHRRRVRSVASKCLHRNRATGPRAEQAEDNLLLALLAIAVVPEGRRRIAATFQVTRSHVVENHCAAAQVPARQAVFDPRLSLPQPVRHRQNLVVRRRTQHRVQDRRRRLRGKLPGRGKPRIRRQHPRHDRRQRKVALATAQTSQDARQTQLPAQPQHGNNLTMRQAAPDFERLVRPLERDPSLHHTADAFHDPRRQAGQVGKGLLANPLAFPSGLAQKNGRAAVAIRDLFVMVGHGTAPYMGTSLVLLYIDGDNSTSPNIGTTAWEQVSRTLHCPDTNNRPSINEITASILPKLIGSSV